MWYSLTRIIDEFALIVCPLSFTSFFCFVFCFFEHLNNSALQQNPQTQKKQPGLIQIVVSKEQSTVWREKLVAMQTIASEIHETTSESLSALNDRKQMPFLHSNTLKFLW